MMPGFYFDLDPRADDFVETYCARFDALVAELMIASGRGYWRSFKLALDVLGCRPLPGDTMPTTIASFPLLCMVLHHVCDASPSDAATSDVLDDAKWVCARARLDYRPDQLVAALDAVLRARAKGYRTPRRLPAC